MKISIQRSFATKQRTDLLVIGVLEQPEPTGTRKKPKRPASLAEIDAEMGGALWKAAAAEQFRGCADSQIIMHSHGQIGARRIMLLGLGPVEKLSVDGYRQAGGRAFRAASAHDSKMVLMLPADESISALVCTEVAAEGVLLAAYKFDRYLTGDQPDAVSDVKIIHPGVGHRNPETVARAEAVAAGVNLARDLVNECPRALTPIQFAAEAKEVGKETGIGITVLTEKEMKRERMGLILAVSQAATPYNPPRLVRMTYRPSGQSGPSAKKAKKHISLVGKGLVFDSGGLDLKPAAGMLEMKIDMGGAAAVIGAMLTIGKLKPDVAVTGYLCCVENAIGGNAYHPSDVLTSRKGLTVEVNNTDAEGRLVLADCIDYSLEKDSPDVLIDVATLTGACMVALGPSTAAVFSDDDDLVQDLRSAGDRSGEDFWRLPLNRDLAYQLKSPLADTKNTGDRFGGAITAALFLEKFVDDRTRWAHLDIAGPCTQDRDHPYTPRGAAGFGVRTLVNFIAPS